MSKAKQILNLKYNQLCAELGDLVIKQDRIVARIDAIKSEIQQIDSFVPTAEQLESQLEPVRDSNES